MKNIKLAALATTLVLAACGGSESSADRVVATSSDKKTPMSNNVRRNEAPVPLSGNKSGPAKMNEEIGSGFDDYMKQKAEAEKAQADKADKKLKFDAEQAALNRAHESAMEDKRATSKENSEVMKLFEKGLEATMLVKLLNPANPCAGQELNKDVADMGNSIGEGLKGTRKGLHAPLEEKPQAAATTAKAEVIPAPKPNTTVSTLEDAPATSTTDGPGEASMTNDS